jgi:hypothetical protein
MWFCIDNNEDSAFRSQFASSFTYCICNCYLDLFIALSFPSVSVLYEGWVYAVAVTHCLHSLFAKGFLSLFAVDLSIGDILFSFSF